MARGDINTVIYIIIESKMETFHTNNTAPNKSYIRLRSVLTFVGIVTAIICLLVSLKEIHSADGLESRALQSMETPKLVNAELLANAVSTVWSFGGRIN
jgi:hypothetical protein